MREREDWRTPAVLVFWFVLGVISWAALAALGYAAWRLVQAVLGH